MDPSLIQFGIDLTHDLDAKYGLRNKTVLSQRDVPGMTRSIIPTLLSRGVTAVTVGVNGGSTPPNLPHAFRWRDPASNSSVRGMYLWGGYGF